MSVSALIDSTSLRFFGPVINAPQRVCGKLTFGGFPEYDVEYSGEDFTLPKQAPIARKLLKPTSNYLLPPSRDYVPLKSAQMGSHAEGAALFNAAVNDPIAKLRVPSDQPTVIDTDKFIEEHFPSIPPEILYKKGIRPFPPRPIKFDDVSEPTGHFYKQAATGLDRSNEPTVQHNVGHDELRAAMKRR